MTEATPDPRVELFDKSYIDTFPKFHPEKEDKRLFEALKNHELIVFYGAGVSMLAGCASWNQLAENVIGAFDGSVYSELEKAVLRELAGIDARKALSICHSRVRGNPELEQYYFNAIRGSVIPKDHAKFTDIHEQLFQLKPAAFVTTNIDKGMESIASQYLAGSKVFNLTTEDKDAAAELRNGNVFYLHGSLDSLTQAILTVDQYIEFYFHPTENRKRFLAEVFSGRFSVLFLGYSLAEYEILQNIYLAVKQGEVPSSDVRHFLLTPIYSRDITKFNIEKSYFWMFSVRAIPYFIDHEGHARLNFVMSELRRHTSAGAATLEEMAAIDTA